MRLYELAGSSAEPIPTSSPSTQFEHLGVARVVDQPRSKKVTLKSIHKLKLRKNRRQAEIQKRLDFLPHMYGNGIEDELEMVRKKDVEKQENREHIRKAALRAIKTQRKREQEINDDAARYLKKRDNEQARRIKALKRQFDKIYSG